MPAPASSYVSQCPTAEESRRLKTVALVAWCVVVAGALLVVGLVLLAPLALARGFTLPGVAVYRAFSAACHQTPERSFYLAGFPLAVCARCAGLYAGFAAGVVLYPLARPLGRAAAPARLWLLLAALPTTIDFALGLSGVWENTHLSRFSTASVLGAAAALYVVPGAADALRAARRLRAGAKVDVGNQPQSVEANSR